MSEKQNLLFEASILGNICSKNLGRSGIFFFAYNILRELNRLDLFNITLDLGCTHVSISKLFRADTYLKCFSYINIDKKQFCSSMINNYKKQISVLLTNITIINLLKIVKRCLLIMKWKVEHLSVRAENTCNNTVANTQVYFSPMGIIPNKIKESKHIKCFICLHDLIPVLFPKYFPILHHSEDVLKEYADGINLCKEYYYFCVSRCTRNDFLHFYGKILNKDNLFVTHVSSAQKFMPLDDVVKLAQVLDKYNVHRKTKYVFSLCTLAPRKNLLFTIKCFFKFIMKHDIQDLYFYLGGSQWNDFNLQLKKQVNEYREYRDKIIRIGYVDDEDVNVLLSHSLFFTYISQYEGFGVPPLEAMQAGTPVITSNNSSLPEVVGDAAIMIDCDSEEQCIKAFEDLYFNSELRESYIQKGFERAKLFSYEKTVNNMANVILNVLGNDFGVREK